MSEIIQLINSLRRGHLVIEEDCWYSCPASGKNCDDSRRGECDCGADKHNAKLDKLLEMIKNETPTL